MTVLCFCSLLKLPVFVNIGEIQQRLLNSAEKHRALAKSIPDIVRTPAGHYYGMALFCR